MEFCAIVSDLLLGGASQGAHGGMIVGHQRRSFPLHSGDIVRRITLKFCFFKCEPGSCA